MRLPKKCKTSDSTQSPTNTFVSARSERGGRGKGERRRGIRECEGANHYQKPLLAFSYFPITASREPKREGEGREDRPVKYCGPLYGESSRTTNTLRIAFVGGGERGKEDYYTEMKGSFMERKPLVVLWSWLLSEFLAFGGKKERGKKKKKREGEKNTQSRSRQKGESHEGPPDSYPKLTLTFAPREERGGEEKEQIHLKTRQKEERANKTPHQDHSFTLRKKKRGGKDKVGVGSKKEIHTKGRLIWLPSICHLISRNHEREKKRKGKKEKGKSEVNSE